MPKVRHDHDSNGYYAALDCHSYGTAHVLLCQLQSKPNLHATSQIGDTWTHFLVNSPFLAWEKIDSPNAQSVSDDRAFIWNSTWRTFPLEMPEVLARERCFVVRRAKAGNAIRVPMSRHHQLSQYKRVCRAKNENRTHNIIFFFVSVVYGVDIAGQR
jgi:hypothetical protein